MIIQNKRHCLTISYYQGSIHEKLFFNIQINSLLNMNPIHLFFSGVSFSFTLKKMSQLTADNEKAARNFIIKMELKKTFILLKKIRRRNTKVQFLSVNFSRRFKSTYRVRVTETKINFKLSKLNLFFFFLIPWELGKTYSFYFPEDL